MTTDNNGHQVSEDGIHCEDCGVPFAKPYIAPFPGGFMEVFPESVTIVLRALDFDLSALSLQMIPADEESPWPVAQISIPLLPDVDLLPGDFPRATTVRYDLVMAPTSFQSEELTHP